MFIPFMLMYLCFIKLQKSRTMKATNKILTIIFTAVFIFHFSSIFASNDGTSVSPKKELSISIAPTTPKEATFEDNFDMNTEMITLSVLAPVTPKEATFDDDPVVDLAPVTPVEAEFEELQ